MAGEEGDNSTRIEVCNEAVRPLAFSIIIIEFRRRYRTFNETVEQRKSQTLFPVEIPILSAHAHSPSLSISFEQAVTQPLVHV